MLHPRVITNWIGALVLCAAMQPAQAADWLPINPAELALTDEPKAPKAAAIYLYREVERDDVVHFESIYNRIKILTEEGREYADIKIPFDRKTESIRGIEARTIRPDGSVVEFNGTIYENLIVEGRGVKVLAKTFTLPDVQVGSIIEYRYRHNLREGYVFNSRWVLSQPLFTKHARFALNPSGFWRVRYSWPLGLPPGTASPSSDRGKVRLETHDVPAFVTEEFMPPANQLKYRVDFVYISDGNNENQPEKYWKKFGKRRYDEVEDFANKAGAMRDAVAEIVAPDDSAETKLRKIYARAQQIRNLSFERSKSEEEEKREGIKDAKNAADVWKRGYGDALEVCWLFLGLVRAAGIEAYPVLVSTRDAYFFDQRVMNPAQLNSAVVLVNLNGKQLYLDPGVSFTPFGMLPWFETGVKGLWLDKNGGTWISTPVPEPQESHIARKANLKLTANGTLEGTLTVTYTGLEALWRRLEERNEDEADRKEFLENDVEYDIPSGIDVKLTNKPDWTGSETPLVAEYELKVGGWASSAGQRVLLTIGLFGQGEKSIFKHATRVHPMYFKYPYTTADEIAIELPPGWQTGQVPKPHTTDLKVVAYQTAVESKAQTLHIKRQLRSGLVILESKFYQQLRDFYQTVRTTDEQQVVITPGRAPGAK